MKYLKTLLLITIFSLMTVPAFAAATQLSSPKPYVEEPDMAAWERVSHAGSYEIRIVMQSDETGKTVTRTFSTTLNRVDLSLFALGNTVTFSVRALPAASAKSKYRDSSWGNCHETVGPNEYDGEPVFAGVSSGRYYLEDENGTRVTGWLKPGNSWYYFNPSERGLAVTDWADINGKYYLFGTDGRMLTGWQAWGGNWYYLDSTQGTMYTGWRQVTPNHTYYFTENAAAGQPFGSLNEAVTTASYPDSKPPYKLQQSSGGNPPAPGSGQQESKKEEADRWKSNPDGSWSYIKGGNTIRNTWEKIGDFWYYFNQNGIMLTGWQFIGSRWYYLEPSAAGRNGYKQGAMWVNATTPDGYKVNGDGCWVENGQVVTTANTGSGSGTGGSSSGTGGGTGQAQITSCRITLTVGEAGPGRCRTAEVTGASYCNVKKVTCSTAQENWNPGEAVAFTVELEAQSGWQFTAKTKYSCSDGEVTGQSGTATTRTVKLRYTPVMKLDAPTCLYINDSCELRWAPVASAGRYKVVLSGGEAGTVTKYVTEPCVDLYEYDNIERTVVNVAVSALREGSSRIYQESDKVTVNDLGTYWRTHSMNGVFERRDGRLRYLQDDGTYAKGWQQLGGSWYHFRGTGASDGPGWYQDSTGYWYYFDRAFRMVTGPVTDGGKTYVMNDGRRPDLPMGAWIQ